MLRRKQEVRERESIVCLFIGCEWCVCISGIDGYVVQASEFSTPTPTPTN